MDQALSSTTRAKDCLAGAGALLSPNQNPDQISESRREAVFPFARAARAGLLLKKRGPPSGLFDTLVVRLSSRTKWPNNI
jgi:hypothetical protein